IPHFVREPWTATTQRTCFKPGILIRNGAAAMRHHDFQVWKIVKYGRVQQRDHSDAFFIDKVQRVAEALGTATGGMDVTRDIKLTHFLVKRIPEPIPQRWRLDAAALSRIGIQQQTNKTLLLNATLEIRQHRFRTDSRSQWQTTHAAEDFRKQLHGS